MADCKWKKEPNPDYIPPASVMKDEKCANNDCPLRGEYRPVSDVKEVRRCEESGEDVLALGGVVRTEAERLAKLFAVCLGDSADILANEICRRVDEIRNKIREQEDT